MGRTYISARSLGEINVQVIMEQFGGGGHLNTAGAQLRMSPEEAIEQIKAYLAAEGLE
jgi:c-di-AMP phosphodiesterase-like protein